MALPFEDMALTFVPSLGQRGVVHLLEVFHSAEAVYAASEEELVERAELRRDIARAIVHRAGFAEAEREIAFCRKNSITPLASTDERYPTLLRQAEDYPAVLYVMGEVAALSQRSVAFVGTRKMTPYGERATTELVEGLAALVPDVNIVSGLAYGIDGAAHRAAVLSHLTSVGVIANALPAIQPTTHRNLAYEMISRGGAVVTELNSKTKQNGRYFIPRNRIIAALSAGVVVVETPDTGGSLSTAAFAESYSRSVMAVPGRMTDATSRGCNRHISEHRARIILSAEDIADELKWELTITQSATSTPKDLRLSSEEEGFVALFANEPISLDVLRERSGLTAGALSLMLMNLELSGAIRQLPGNKYEKLI